MLPKHSGNIAVNVSKQELMRRFDSKGATRAIKTGALNLQRGFDKPDDYFSAGAFMDKYGTGFQGYQININTNKEYREYFQQVCRNYYNNDVVIGGAVDVYSRFPIAEARIECKDKGIEDFYNDLFFNELGYEDFMVWLLKEYFTIGEAFVMSNWDDNLGIYTSESIVDPSNFEVRPTPLLNTLDYFLIPSDEMRKIINAQPSPGKDAFMAIYGDFKNEILTGQNIPIGHNSIDHIFRKANPGDFRGTPLLRRTMPWLSYEDKLRNAIAAIAERLGNPLTLFTLGFPGGNGQDPWLPLPDQVDDFRDNLNAALTADFRALVTYLGVQSQEIFKSDRIQNWQGDFDAIDQKKYMTYGLSADMFKPSQGGQSNAYASTAVRFELAMQLLATAQRYVQRHFRKRAEVIAEANEFYDYDVIGSQKKVLYDTVTKVDEDGNRYEEEVPRLLIPELNFNNLNFKSADEQRKLLLELKKEGLPITSDSLLVGTKLDFSELQEKKKDETVENALQEARTDKAIVRACIDQDLPVPADVVKRLVEGQPTNEIKAVLGDKVDLIETSLSDGDGDPETSDTDTTEDSEGSESRFSEPGQRPPISDERRQDKGLIARMFG